MIYLRLHDRLGNLMFMIATALHLDSNVSVFCNNEQDYRYVWRMIQKLNLPITIEAPCILLIINLNIISLLYSSQFHIIEGKICYLTDIFKVTNIFVERKF